MSRSSAIILRSRIGNGRPNRLVVALPMLLLWAGLSVSTQAAPVTGRSRSRSMSRSRSSSIRLSRVEEFSRDVRVALSGGIAGSVGTLALYPIDTAKTLRQTDPVKYPKMKDALVDLFFSSDVKGGQGAIRAPIRLNEAYRGVTSATLGAVPSSALYFGTYEFVKKVLGRRACSHWSKKSESRKDVLTSTAQLPAAARISVHSLSAASGNAVSSLIFVPKEFIKQQLQAYGSGRLVAPPATSAASAALTQNGLKTAAATAASGAPIALTSAQRAAYGIAKQLNSQTQARTVLRAAASVQEPVVCTTAGCVIQQTIKRDGVRGLYRGYQATLLRNIPTAVMRFALYEEIKLLALRTTSAGSNTAAVDVDSGGFSPLFFLSGALAGAVASGCMTPVDVLKTRMATGAIPSNLNALGGLRHIYQQNGWSGLYAGGRARMVWSGAFSAIGFGSFEAAKSILGVRAPAHDGAAGMDRSRRKATEKESSSSTRKGAMPTLVSQISVAAGQTAENVMQKIRPCVA